MRFLNGTSRGDVVTFRCKDGFDLLGFRQLVCGEDDQWSGRWSFCIEGMHMELDDQGQSRDSILDLGGGVLIKSMGPELSVP